MFSFKKKDVPAEIAGVKVKVSRRARRLSLKVDAREGGVVLVWPRGASEKSAVRFVEQNKLWIEKRRQTQAASRKFSPGERIQVCGKEYILTHSPGRGLSRMERDQLIVCGREEHFSRRVASFLKTVAGHVLSEASTQKLARLDLRSAGIRIADPKTRWGSCSRTGKMMFSWRLILTPPDVLDYVVAHEVAHCVHMNHSKQFWQLCASLTGDMGASRRWLKLHGNNIMSYK